MALVVPRVATILASLTVLACAPQVGKPPPEERGHPAAAAAAPPAGPARVRPPGVAGSWYPGSADALAKAVDRMLDEARPPRVPGGPVRALVVPHAGYDYSGPTAAMAFKTVRGETRRRVIVLGPAHEGMFRGVAIDDFTHYRTPLGDIPIDRAAIARLRSDPHFVPDERAGAREHSIEMELPLLQRALRPGFSLVPLLVGTIEPADAAAIAEVIRPLGDDEALIVVSSDFTHYGPRYDFIPFRPDAGLGKRLEQLDIGLYRRLADLDPAGLVEYQQRTHINACGYDALLIAANLLAPDVRPVLVHYETSGGSQSDPSSVSYVAAAFAGPHAPADARQALGRADMRALLGVASRTLKHAVRGGPDAETIPSGLEPRGSRRLGDPGASFVTLRKHGELRGCIGTLNATRPLWQSVASNAISAALHDDRFSPLKADEVRQLEIEVSVLSPLRSIESHRAFRLGAEGIVLHKGPMSAVFLPDVATEEGWSKEELLEELSEKAGLPKNGWQSGATFEVFTSQIIDGTVQ